MPGAYYGARSCARAQVAPGNRSEAEGAVERDSPVLAALVVWFRDFLKVEHDAAVGSGGSGAWGSRPSRLLRVIDQRVGCPQEAVQLVRRVEGALTRVEPG